VLGTTSGASLILVTARSDETKEDVVLLAGPTEDGQGIGVVRKRGKRLDVGELRPSSEGKPVHGELVRLHARTPPGVYDVEVLYDATSEEAASAGGTPSDKAHAGPARATSDRYRQGWDRVFRRTGDLPN
jgi:hypothetical protein